MTSASCNFGTTPVQFDSDIGRFRALAGDTNYTAVDGQPGVGNFESWSDDEIAAYLSSTDGNVYRAIGYAYLALASAAALHAKSVADYDLKVDTTKTPDALRSTANYWFTRDREEDKLNGGGDIFEVFDTVSPESKRHPEAMIREVLR